MKAVQAYNNQKLSKVITLSSNYRKHRENIAGVRAAVDCTDRAHMQKALKLFKEKDQYTHNVRNLKLSELKRENNQIIKRILGTKSPIKKQLSPGRISLRQNTSLNRTPSRQSVASRSSQKSCGSNFRRRTLRLQQIDRQNKKIAARIQKPKMAKDMNYLKLCKFYQQEQSYSRIRSRFSERSQSIMQSLALDNLGFQQRNVQFLPQLSFKRLDKTVRHKNKTVFENTTATPRVQELMSERKGTD